MKVSKIYSSKILRKFADKCRTMSKDDIYELIDSDGKKGVKLRDAIYEVVDGIDVNEPVRMALTIIGAVFCVQVLIDW